ncbi:MAG: heavy metal-binding domain-containing protein [Bacteriovoracaceae bacterium]|nr:heavy metal-binding domain-containing protein [Bacteriovoracaceae bacterium]
MEQIIGIVALVAIGLVFGVLAEKKHYASILQREKNTLNFPVVTIKSMLKKNDVVESSNVAVGSVVLAFDYFKRFVAGFKMILGGRLTTYESLLDRARREAILRMKENAGDADMLINVRLETSTISKGRAKRGAGAIEVMAYGTAVKLK